MYRLTVRYALLSHDPVHRVDEPHGPSSVRCGRAASVVPAASTLDVVNVPVRGRRNRALKLASAGDGTFDLAAHKPAPRELQE